MDHLREKVRMLGKLCRRRAFGAAVLLLALSLTACKVSSQLRIISVDDEGEVQTYYAWEDDPMALLARNGYEIASYDIVEATDSGGMRGSISITRAYPVTVRADGDETTVMLTGGTVETALKRANVSLGRDDLVEPGTEQRVMKDDVVTVTRQEHETLKIERELPYDTRQLLTPLLAPGEVEVVEEGEEGLRVSTYTQTRLDGRLVDHKLLDNRLVQQPVDETLIAGFPSHPVSTYDFAWEFDEHGVPINYKYAITGARAAGYSSPAGSGTASGRPARVGNVAVNPREIPYGSKLYIASADGSFVYGYAVAADTGTSLTNNTIDVDLYYDSYTASAANGIRYVNIYVLE